MTPPRNPFWARLALNVLELPVALGLAFALFVLVGRWGCWWARCVDVSGLPWMLGGALFGLAVGATYWILSARRPAATGQRLVVAAGIVAFSVVAVLLPVPTTHL